MFDPETILYRVWQRDIPPGWHVYPRLSWRAWMFGGILTLLLVVAGLVPFIFAPAFWLHNSAVFVGLILVAIVLGTLFLVFGTRQGLDFPLSKHPDGVLIVMPEGMVEFVSTRVAIYTLPFAEVRELTRRQDDGRAWLEVVSQDGSLAEWTPRAIFGERAEGYVYEVIFGRIVRAFEAYQAREGGEEAVEWNDDGEAVS